MRRRAARLTTPVAPAAPRCFPIRPDSGTSSHWRTSQATSASGFVLRWSLHRLCRTLWCDWCHDSACKRCAHVPALLHTPRLPWPALPPHACPWPCEALNGGPIATNNHGAHRLEGLYGRVGEGGGVPLRLARRLPFPFSCAAANPRRSKFEPPLAHAFRPAAGWAAWTGDRAARSSPALESLLGSVILVDTPPGAACCRLRIEGKREVSTRPASVSAAVRSAPKRGARVGTSRRELWPHAGSRHLMQRTRWRRRWLQPPCLQVNF